MYSSSSSPHESINAFPVPGSAFQNLLNVPVANTKHVSKALLHHPKSWSLPLASMICSCRFVGVSDRQMFKWAEVGAFKHQNKESSKSATAKIVHPTWEPILRHLWSMINITNLKYHKYQATSILPLTRHLQTPSIIAVPQQSLQSSVIFPGWKGKSTMSLLTLGTAHTDPHGLMYHDFSPQSHRPTLQTWKVRVCFILREFSWHYFQIWMSNFLPFFLKHISLPGLACRGARVLKNEESSQLFPTSLGPR